MVQDCLRCEKDIDDLYLICNNCVKELFTRNLFWIDVRPILGSPVIDRYREDSEPVLRIGDIPGDEVEFKVSSPIKDELKSFVIDIDKEDYKRTENKLSMILAELGIQEEFESESYVFSKEDTEVFSEIFFIVEKLEHKFSNEDGVISLYNQIGNLFFYTGINVDSYGFEKGLRKRLKDKFFEEAEGYYEMALNIDNNNITVQKNKGYLYLKKKEYAKAKENFQNIYKSDVDAKLGLIRSYISLNKYEKTEKHLKEIFEENKDNPEIWYLRGKLEENKGRWGGAIQNYNQALDIRKDHFKSFISKTDILLDKNMYSQANQLYDDYLKIDDLNQEIWFKKGKALFEMGKWGRAIQCIDKSLILDMQNPEAWLFKGHILLDEEDFEAAKSAFENALKINPRLEEAQQGIKKIKKKLGE